MCTFRRYRNNKIGFLDVTILLRANLIRMHQMIIGVVDFRLDRWKNVFPPFEGSVQCKVATFARLPKPSKEMLY